MRHIYTVIRESTQVVDEHFYIEKIENFGFNFCNFATLQVDYCQFVK